MKELGRTTQKTLTTKDRWSELLTYITDVVQPGETNRWKSINTHTHTTYAIATYTNCQTNCFHYRTNSVKTNDQIFQIKKSCFWPIFGPFSQICQGNLAVRCNFIWVSSTMPKFRKNHDTIPRKCLDWRTDRRMDRPYFIAPFWLLTGIKKKFLIYPFQEGRNKDMFLWFLHVISFNLLWL